MNQAGGDFALMAGDIALRLGDDPEFFLKLTGQRLSLCFAWLDFTAGEFPHPGLVGVCRSLCQQNLSVAFDNGGNNINGF
ncbi:hypothetical protein SB6422_02893 [Klebsiella huaxiensis]|uniref:Uncharacterized protein n=1 Tax=Klebsiella huaxiensis TaxID=2153354 RepID=A0A564MBV2_9ENTR|nr:hypothetical protein SB6422_02893 [Klebsiella huaxiensis]